MRRYCWESKGGLREKCSAAAPQRASIKGLHPAAVLNRRNYETEIASTIRRTRTVHFSDSPSPHGGTAWWHRACWNPLPVDLGSRDGIEDPTSSVPPCDQPVPSIS